METYVATFYRISFVSLLLATLTGESALADKRIGTESLVCAEIGPVLDIPAKVQVGADLGAGPGAHIAFMFATPFGQILEISTGLLLPSSDDRDYSILEFPVSATLLIAASPESRSTAYVGVGPSWLLTHAEMTSHNYENGM